MMIPPTIKEAKSKSGNKTVTKKKRGNLDTGKKARVPHLRQIESMLSLMVHGAKNPKTKLLRDFLERQTLTLSKHTQKEPA